MFMQSSLFILMHNMFFVQTLDPKLEKQLGKIRDSAPKYSLWTKIKVIYR